MSIIFLHSAKKPFSFYSILCISGALIIASAFANGEGAKPISNKTKDAAGALCTACKTPSRTDFLSRKIASSKSEATKAPKHSAETGNGKDAAQMVYIPGGMFEMGTNDPNFPDAQPVHKVTLSPFYMDEHDVTNAQFAKFVKATGFVTVEQRPLDPKDFPGVPKSKLVSGSAVFSPPDHAVSLNNPLVWWKYVPGADWQHPTGPKSNIKGHGSDPVVQVCYTDAAAYAKWAGKSLPTEAQWEFAARGGKKGDPPYYWGDKLKPGGKWVANIYEGQFPDKNSGADGFVGISPVKSFPANPCGLYDMDGDVWQWCSDFYRPDYYAHSPEKNPKGPASSYDPDEPNAVKRVQRGGSFLCSDEYCLRYRAGSRGKGEINSAANNLGFRCVKNIAVSEKAASKESKSAK